MAGQPTAKNTAPATSWPESGPLRYSTWMTVTTGMQTLDERAGVHVHVPAAEGTAQFSRNGPIGRWHQRGPGLEQADADAQVVQDGGDLAAGVGPADHGDPVRAELVRDGMSS